MKNKKGKIRNWDWVKNAVELNGAIYALNEIRKTHPSNYYSDLQSFRRIAILDTAKLFRLGSSEIGHLLWSYPPLTPISLKNELAWASAWLSGQATKINAYRCFEKEIQEIILAGEIDTAAANLDIFCVKSGWSLWAIELRLALEQLSKGIEAQKSLAATWKSIAQNGTLRLIAQVVSDRNDPTFSYDAFHWNCLNAFPEFTNAGDWLPTYLIYRSLSSLYGKKESALPIILSRELTSSLIDYYEAIIETLVNIVNDTTDLQSLRPDAIRVINTLLKDGYTDCRLQKLHIALTGIMPSNNALSVANSPSVQLLFDACTSRLCWDELPSNISPFLQDVLKDVRQCDEEGIQALEAITNIVKLGTNLKSLDIGVAIGISPQLLAGDLTSQTVLPLALSLTVCGWQFDEITALEDEIIEIFLESSAQDECCAMHERVASFLNVLHGNPIEDLAAKDSLSYLWLGRQLIKQKRWDEAFWLCDCMADFGSYFLTRQSEKLRLKVFTNKGELKKAFELMTQWLLKASHYATEFPIAKIFTDRKFSSFTDIDPILVGLVSHHAYITTEDQDIHGICKMACQEVAIMGGLKYVSEKFDITNDKTINAILIAFARDVWIEENLTMNYFLESTEDVRNERMQVMQLLMNWDEQNKADYIDAIKELTLDKTLRNGLRQIDQTRVFANEVALYRWAEKELYQDYERLMKLLESQSNDTLSNDLIRQYLVSPNNIDFLQELGGGEPTEADALLIKLLERLFERFLHDPYEGLDCYLSLRIRHGSLRGTLFGVLEDQRLLYSSTGLFSQTAFDKRWGSTLNISEQDRVLVIAALETFTMRLKGIGDDLVNDCVQIISEKKPKGAIPDKISRTDVKLFRAFTKLIAESNISFQSLVYMGYSIFWKLLEPSLIKLGMYVRQDVKNQLQAEFDTLAEKLRNISPQTMPLVTTIHTVATTTQSQCDTIADWFKPPQTSGHDNYAFSIAIDIAKTATTNVYRAFPIDVSLCNMPEQDLSLSPSGLSVVTDCLFVIFENAWKHSGLREEIGALDLYANFDSVNKLLTFKVFSNLSKARIEILKTNELEILKTKYLSQNNAELARCEGGSGLPKLARLTRLVDRTLVLHPLEFDIVDQRWMIQITIPLYEREGLYEAYE